MTAKTQSNELTVAAWRSWRVWFVAAAVWLVPALLLGTHQFMELRGTGKQLSWLEAMAFQGPSWLLLIPATPFVCTVVRRWPVSRDHPSRVAGHVLGGFVFGALFLLVAVPVRNALHPNPHQWSALGGAFYKSVPQYVTLGALAYWGIVIVGSLLETRSRLAAVLLVDAGTEDVAAEGRPIRITLTTPGGEVHLEPDEVEWIEVRSSGCCVHTLGGPVSVRHSMSDLEERLGAWGFARIHRSTMVNVGHVRSVEGAPTRDGEVVLRSGTRLSVARRRRPQLDSALG